MLFTFKTYIFEVHTKIMFEPDMLSWKNDLSMLEKSWEMDNHWLAPFELVLELKSVAFISKSRLNVFIRHVSASKYRHLETQHLSFFRMIQVTNFPFLSFVTAT